MFDFSSCFTLFTFPSVLTVILLPFPSANKNLKQECIFFQTNEKKNFMKAFIQKCNSENYVFVQIFTSHASFRYTVPFFPNLVSYFIIFIFVIDLTNYSVVKIFVYLVYFLVFRRMQC